MLIKDLSSASGHLQIHISLSDHNTCYIYINDVYNNCLRMRWFNNYESALAWINTLGT